MEAIVGADQPMELPGRMGPRRESVVRSDAYEVMDAEDEVRGKNIVCYAGSQT